MLTSKYAVAAGKLAGLNQHVAAYLPLTHFSPHFFTNFEHQKIYSSSFFLAACRRKSRNYRIHSARIFEKVHTIFYYIEDCGHKRLPRDISNSLYLDFVNRKRRKDIIVIGNASVSSHLYIWRVVNSAVMMEGNSKKWMIKYQDFDTSCMK